MTGTFQHGHGALHVDRQVFRRPLDRRYEVANAAVMKDIPSLAKQRIVRRVAANIAFLKDKLRIALMLRQIGATATGKIVDDAYAHTARQAQVDHVAADKAGASGDDGD